MLYPSGNILVTFGTGKQVCCFPAPLLLLPTGTAGKEISNPLCHGHLSIAHLTCQQLSRAAITTQNADMTQRCTHSHGTTGQRNDDRSEPSNGEIREVKAVLHLRQCSPLETRGELQSTDLQTQDSLYCSEMADRVLPTGTDSLQEHRMGEKKAKIKSSEAFLITVF